MKKIKLTDAQQMQIKYPDTFKALTKQELKAIKKGSLVKICANNKERFWVKITEVKSNMLKGNINNDLLNAKEFGVNLGDMIKFEKKHIYNIY